VAGETGEGRNGRSVKDKELDERRGDHYTAERDGGHTGEERNDQQRGTSDFDSTS